VGGSAVCYQELLEAKALLPKVFNKKCARQISLTFFYFHHAIIFITVVSLFSTRQNCVFAFLL